MGIIEELEKILENTPEEELKQVWDSFGEDTENDIFIEEYLEIVKSYTEFSSFEPTFKMEGLGCEIETTFMDQAA